MSWYSKSKKEKDPYKIFLITPGGSKQIGKEEAYSAVQAKKRFLDKDTKDYASYLEMGYTIKAILDEEEVKRRKEIKEREEKDLEDFVQNAWWQD